ncbi:Dabb family protein [Collimonas sp. NPDC087041]|uniref:Dabb family protein n=1 Tax=Collimonas sp. NPDC087041 TaxID=3363960 RepID=UPI0037F1E0B5
MNTVERTMKIRHLVLLRFKQDTSASEQAHCMRDFAKLADLIEGIVAFEHGVNTSPEGLNKGYTHAATITFASHAFRDAYLDHDAHQAFVARLKPWLDEVLVFDYDI